MAYKITYRTPTLATPYALVYGVEAVLPLEKQIPSLRIAIQEGLTEEENARLRLEELEALDEKRLEAQQRTECYQACLSRSFNKKVNSRSFQIGGLVLAVRRRIIMTHRTGNKFTSKWDGPYDCQRSINKWRLQVGCRRWIENWPEKWEVLQALLCMKLKKRLLARMS